MDLCSFLFLSGPLSGHVLLVADLFHPVGRLAVNLLHDSDMGHGRGWRGAMPMLLTGREPDHIARPDFLDRAAPTLRPAATGRHDEGLAERVGMPGCPGAGLEGDAGAENTRRRGRVEQRVNAHRTGEILCRSFAGRLRASS